MLLQDHLGGDQASPSFSGDYYLSPAALAAMNWLWDPVPLVATVGIEYGFVAKVGQSDSFSYELVSGASEPKVYTGDLNGAQVKSGLVQWPLTQKNKQQ